ncbi:MAG: hypothetical protein IJ315_06260 [Firmicutes bacterium]|nr:hypothetical protein [Bacillota bacterium]
MSSKKFMNSDDERYDQICRKLGFIPSEYRYNGPSTEDDNWKSPFSILTLEEMMYLYEHGYLYKKN